MDRASMYKVFGGYSNSSDQRGNYQIESLKFAHEVMHMAKCSFRMSEFYEKLEGLRNGDHGDLCMFSSDITNPHTSPKCELTGTENPEKWISKEPIVYRHEELKDFRSLIAVPDHFHDSCHEVINGMKMIDDAINPADLAYKNYYTKKAEAIQNEWTKGRMDLAAQSLFRFCDKCVFED